MNDHWAKCHCKKLGFETSFKKSMETKLCGVK